MTFSTTVKDEIISGNISNECCKISLLSAIIRSCGIIEISDDIVSLSIKTSNINVANLLEKLVDIMYGISVSIQTTGKTNSRQYEIWLYDCLQILLNCGIVNSSSSLVVGINKDIIKKSCCIRNYIKGLFIGCGSLHLPASNSSKDAYHMEFALTNTQVATDLQQLLISINIEAKLSSRKDLSVVYIKNKEIISDLLAYLGANRGVIQLQEVIISRLLRNTANRRANCDYANTDKTQGASFKQIEAINKLKTANVYNLLDDKLKQAAAVRLSHPYDSLQQLTANLNNTVTKSGLNHRLRKLVEMANSLSND